MSSKEIRKGNISEIQPFEHLGISESNISLGIYEKGNIRMPVIIKNSPGSYRQEIKGARLLNDHIPIIWPLDFIDEDTTIYPWLGNARSLDAVLTDPLSVDKTRQELLDMYLGMHVNMWNETHTYTRRKNSGYIHKIDQTKQAFSNLTLGKSSMDKEYPLKIRLLKHEIYQGTHFEESYGIESINNSFSWMEDSISESVEFGSSVTHGDENFHNCLVRNPVQQETNYVEPLIMIDLNGAGYRSPFESMAKILSWLRATQVEQHSFRYGISQKHVGHELIVNYSLDRRYQEIEERIKLFFQRNLNVFKTMDETAFDKYLRAYQMMYFLREATLYSGKRGRSDVIPYLLGKAFSFSPKVEI